MLLFSSIRCTSSLYSLRSRARAVQAEEQTMEVTISQAQGRVPVTIFAFAGAVTTNRELEAQAQAAYAGGARNILLDLTDVSYMATAGLRALHSIFTLLRSDTP